MSGTITPPQDPASAPAPAPPTLAPARSSLPAPALPPGPPADGAGSEVATVDHVAPGPVGRLLRDRRLMHYHRLTALVVLANGLAVARGWITVDGADPVAAVDSLTRAAAVNLSLAVLIRQQHVINLLFRLATAAPRSWPLPVRRVLGKVYHVGGLHVGGAVMGTGWFAVLAARAVSGRVTGGAAVSDARLVVILALVAVLAAMVVTARPSARARAHDRFERVHRFGGWGALVLFWVVAVQAALGRPPTAADPADPVTGLALDPVVWLLAASTLSVALPWLRLRRVDVDLTVPSDHVALVRFDHGVTPFAGSSTTVSRNPLLEWHAFANVPTPGRDGFRLTISRAGDWTGALIDDRPERLWVKGVPTAGVGNIDQLFHRVVWVATGSGIGPTLPHLLAREVPAHLVWATRDPVATYGRELVDEILAVQPDALIWDTHARGKPDMVDLAHRAVVETGAEAAICISNKKLTWQVVEGLERRGVPAFGAIWDS